MTKSRPGGRTARTKQAAFEAAAALMVERGPAGVTMSDIAERAGVAATSLYRRWGDVRGLLMDVAVEALMREQPLPDTGSLRADLRAWAIRIVQGFGREEGSAFFRILLATAPPVLGDGTKRTAALSRRLDEISEMLRRARARGEWAPSPWDVSDHLLGPIYMRALFGAPLSEDFAMGLADRLLDGAPSRPVPASLTRP